VTWQSHDLLRIVEQIPVGVAVTEPSGAIEYANPHLCRALRLDPERLSGVNLSELRTSDNGLLSDHIRLRLLAGGSWQEEAQFRTGGGDALHVLESAYPLRNAEGRVTHFVHLLQDLSLLRIPETLKSLAFHDKLTGLPNRNLFHNRLALAMATARRTRHGFAVLSADIDRFKLVNDTLGRDAGDELLRRVGERLRACFRETDTVARLGADEFAAILDRVLDPDTAARMADKLLAACCGYYDVQGNRLRITMSVGMSLYPRDGQEADVLLRRADLAMYRAKATGRNRTELRDPGSQLRYGLGQDAGLSGSEADSITEAQPLLQFGGDVHRSVRIDQHRARDAHARCGLPPAARTLDENRLRSCVRERARPFPA
jgi:diguanylate cyclase (GGDEF)-like protein/PAS domain S-box-containing protein